MNTNLANKAKNQKYAVSGKHHSLKPVSKTNLTLDQAVVFAQQLKTANYYNVSINPVEAEKKMLA